MSVRWGNILSESFNVSNGVRQGGTLFPYLSNLYMDDLSSRLNEIYAGCKIANVIINHLFYADDIVLMSPFHRGLLELLVVCEKYALEHDIKFDTKKVLYWSDEVNYLKMLLFPHLSYVMKN